MSNESILLRRKPLRPAKFGEQYNYVVQRMIAEATTDHSARQPACRAGILIEDDGKLTWWSSHYVRAAQVRSIAHFRDSALSDFLRTGTRPRTTGIPSTSKDITHSNPVDEAGVHHDINSRTSGTAGGEFREYRTKSRGLSSSARHKRVLGSIRHKCSAPNTCFLDELFSTLRRQLQPRRRTAGPENILSTCDIVWSSVVRRPRELTRAVARRSCYYTRLSCIQHQPPPHITPPKLCRLKVRRYYAANWRPPTSAAPINKSQMHECRIIQNSAAEVAPMMNGSSNVTKPCRRPASLHAALTLTPTTAVVLRVVEIGIPPQ